MAPSPMSPPNKEEQSAPMLHRGVKASHAWTYCIIHGSQYLVHPGSLESTHYFWLCHHWVLPVWESRNQTHVGIPIFSMTTSYAWWPHRTSAVWSVASVWFSAEGNRGLRCRSAAAKARVAQGSCAPLTIRPSVLGLVVDVALTSWWSPF